MSASEARTASERARAAAHWNARCVDYTARTAWFRCPIDAQAFAAEITKDGASKVTVYARETTPYVTWD